MGTQYNLIKDRFYKLLRNDKKYFNYTGLDSTTITQLTNDHFVDLLNQSIDELYNFSILPPQIDFYNKDDTLMQFNVDLNKKEIGLLASICYYKYFCEDKNKLHEMSMIFKGNELNALSPANERRSVLDMINELEDNVSTDIINYMSIDRLTGKIRTKQTQIDLR